MTNNKGALKHEHQSETESVSSFGNNLVDVEAQLKQKEEVIVFLN
jgi:hypothetical protein